MLNCNASRTCRIFFPGNRYFVQICPFLSTVIYLHPTATFLLKFFFIFQDAEVIRFYCSATINYWDILITLILIDFKVLVQSGTINLDLSMSWFMKKYEDCCIYPMESVTLWKFVGDYNYSHLAVVEWCYKFRQWRDSTKDLARSGPQRVAASDGNVRHLEIVLQANRIKNILKCWATTHSIIHSLGHNKVTSQWIPQLLTNEQKIRVWPYHLSSFDELSTR